MSSPSITIQSVTGVDIELRIAGPGSRSYAFVIDWHIRVVLALAWLVAAHFLYAGSLWFAGLGQGGAQARYLLTVWLPPLLIYFLYHPVLEIAMRGRTPGKRMAGVRLVTRDGDIPGVGALLLRNIFRVLDCLPQGYLLGLAVVVFTRQHLRVGDLAAGTLLVLDQDGGAASFMNEQMAGSGTLTPQAADLIHELLGRWPALTPEHRTRLARLLLERVQPALRQEEMAGLDGAALRQRLSALLAGEPAR